MNKALTGLACASQALLWFAVVWAGSPLAALNQVHAAIIINEIHYAPDVKTEAVEFIELYNPGSNSVDLTGWSLRGGVDFAFPAAANVPPDGYVLVAQDPTALASKFGVTNVVGPWRGKLSNEGDRVVLQTPAGEAADEVTYQLGFPWPTVGDIPGHSIELVNPALDNDLGGSWRSSTEGNTPIPGNSILPTGSVWRYFKGTSEASDPRTAWRQPGFDDSEWAVGAAPIGFGESFIATALADMQSNYASVFFRNSFVLEDPAAGADLVLDLLFDDGFRAWVNGLEIISYNLGTGEAAYNRTAASSVEFGEYIPVPLVQASRFFRAGTNVVAVQVHNASLGNGDFFFDLGLRTQPGISPRGATPGAKNSVYADNLPPQIRQVEHKPDQPASRQPVVVTAKVTDPDGVASVELEYQIVAPGAYIALSDRAYLENWVSLSMNDAGAGIDTFPGDAIYSAQIPAEAQSHRRLIRYRIVATDRGGRAITVPHADDPQPNFAYFTYDGVPAWTGAIQPASSDPARNTPAVFGTNLMRRLPVYHLISKQSDVQQATWPPVDQRYWGDQYNWRGTLVYDGKVYDHIGYRARGGSWRYAMGKNMWKFDFNRGHDFQPRDNYSQKYGVPWRKLNLGACIQQGDYQHRGEQGMFESVGFRLFDLAGVEAPKTHFAQLRIVADAEESNATNQYAGDFWGLYLATEQLDGRFLDEHGLPDGNFYKMEGGTGELNNQGPAGPADKSDLDAFMSAYRGATLPDDWWRQNFSLDRYYSYQAIVQGIHHYDICHLKNYFYFADPDTGVWSVHPWDIDLTWANNMYDAGCGGADELKNRVLNRPAFKLEYQNRVRELRDLLFNTDQAWRLIDEYAAMIDDPKGGPGFVDADRALWDYNPVMANSRIVNPSKAGQGRFYQAVPSKDFPGMVKKMKDYVITRGTFLDNLANDPSIPDKPVVTSSAWPRFPADRLVFQSSPYSGSNSFAAIKWRLAEVTGPGHPPFEPDKPHKYEIESLWESPPLPDATASIRIPLEAVRIGHTYRVRARMGDATGRWSHWSDPIEFTVGSPAGSETVQDVLRVSELMSDPAGGSDLEFIELNNVSSSTPIDLSGARFTQGIDYTFPVGSVLPPGGYLLVVRASKADNFKAFRLHYGLSEQAPIVGPYAGALNNEGEQLTLKDIAGADLLSFTYGNGRAWPLACAGTGHSLIPMASMLAPGSAGNLNYPGSWRASTYLNGSPAAADPLPIPGVVLNEIVAHTDLLSELDSNDWIELYNPTSAAVTFGPGWYLSDDTANLRKWQIPASTVLQPHSWVVFDEVTGFHSPASGGFGLSKDGEQVLLSYLPGSSADRVVDSVSFKAQENDWSWGRYPDGTGDWLGLTPRTSSAVNPEPPVRVIINELMFHPQATLAYPEDNVLSEYIEIYNPTSTSAALFNTNGVWRLDGGIQFLFPHNTTLPAGGVLLVVNFPPSDLAALDSFKSTFKEAATAAIVGPYQGKLNNSTDRVALEKPQFPETPGSAPAWVVVDELIYSDQAPWPSQADGSGLALHRRSLTAPGSDPANWRAALPSAGSPGGAEPVDLDQDGMPDDWERSHGLDPNSAADAAEDADSDSSSNLTEYNAGTDPNDPDSALRLGVSPSAGSVLLHFSAAPGRGYTVSYCDLVSAGRWQSLADIAAGSTARVVELADATSTAARYYRVELRSGR